MPLQNFQLFNVEGLEHHAGEEGHGIHEDLVDTIHMIRSDGRLAAVLAVQMFGLLAYNYAGTPLPITSSSLD